MREIIQNNYSFGNDSYSSVFLGYCDSQNKLDAYVKMDYSLFADGYIGSELGVDFGINYVEEDHLIAVNITERTNEVAKILVGVSSQYIIDFFNKNFSMGLPFLSNSCIIVEGLKYEGKINEVENPEFGHFKFIGTAKIM